jgi:hypothetical protein
MDNGAQPVASAFVFVPGLLEHILAIALLLEEFPKDDVFYGGFRVIESFAE